MQVITQHLTQEAFVPFGQVFTAPEAPGRVDMVLDNRRAHAQPTMILVNVPPSDLPLTASLMERHLHSSQAFVPMDVSRYLVIVAPHKPDGGPDIARVQAFIAASYQGVNYNPNTWHHGVTVLDRPGRFAVFMWNDGSDQDTEFLDVRETFDIHELA